MSLADIKNRIHQTEVNFSKSIGDTKLIAVSKVQPIARIDSVLEQGHRVFGENRIQEAQSKWPAFKEKYEDVELHIIGPLQTNKTRAAMELADSIHTLDRLKLAKNIARLAQEIGKCPELFVQVNTGDEQQKADLEGALQQWRDRFDRETTAAQQATGSDDAGEANDGHDRPAAKTIPDPIQHAGHCRGAASRRQAAVRDAGWPRPRRCSRPRGDAGPAARRRAGAIHPRDARGRARARPAAVASR